MPTFEENANWLLDHSAENEENANNVPAYFSRVQPVESKRSLFSMRYPINFNQAYQNISIQRKRFKNQSIECSTIYKAVNVDINVFYIKYLKER